MLFLCQVTPYLRVYNPATGGFAAFAGGRLELDEGDGDYEVVKAEALRNPSIIMLTEATQCPYCSEPFTGKAAAAHLGKHKKDAHFNEWAKEKQAEQPLVTVEVKGRQPYACDLCVNIAPFPSEDALAIHIRAIHIATEIDDDGNVAGSGEGGERQAGTVPAEPAAARAR